MAMLTGYFDAAGDPKARHALTVGGYVSPVRSWGRFRRDWRKVLDPVGIDVFHMTDFMACEGDFKSWADRTRDRASLLRNLSKVIVRHAHFGSATTILLDDWKRLNQEFMLKECHATPYCLAAFSVIDKSIRWIGREHGSDHLKEFVFERGDTGFGDLLCFIRWVREATGGRLAKNVDPIQKPKTLEPLQAADFVAWQHRDLTVRRQEGQLISFSESFQMLMKVKYDWGVIQYPKLRDYCASLEIPKRGPGVLASQKDRAKWRPRPLVRPKPDGGRR